MRVIFTFLCVLIAVASASEANASEQRLRVSEVHEFVANMNNAMNNPTWNRGHAFLQTAISNNAVFENQISNRYVNHWPHYYGTVVNNRYHYPYYSYRYPYAYNGFVKTGVDVMNKWDMISSIEHKNSVIPGYEARITLKEVNMPANALSAVVDVDLKEYSLAYGPYAPHFTHDRLASFSKCKLYLSKSNYEVFLSRMDCNTNSNLPL